ncbi:MAG: hypothetical protein MZV64_32660 [Ignavibacteriales bacterium]|nr:hypothetical protein [Ignavibacteriales bacterium]
MFALTESYSDYRKAALTGTVFTYAIISLALLFLGYHFLYLLTKEMKGTTAALLFFTLVFSIAAFIISDQKGNGNFNSGS